MTLHSLRVLLAGASLVVIAACAEYGPAGTAPALGSAPLGLDLGSSSRVQYVAALAGEGEGYGIARPSAAAEHASMPGMVHAAHGAGRAGPQSSASPAGHGGIPGSSQVAPSQSPSSHAGHGGTREPN